MWITQVHLRELVFGRWKRVSVDDVEEEHHPPAPKPVSNKLSMFRRVSVDDVEKEKHLKHTSETTREP